MVYYSLAEKNKILKEKIDQLAKQLDIQKDIVKQREAAIESLLAKMDGLESSNQDKINQIVTLKNELKLLKDQAQLPRKENRPTSSSSAYHSHKNSLDGAIASSQGSKDKGELLTRFLFFNLSLTKINKRF